MTSAIHASSNSFSRLASASTSARISLVVPSFNSAATIARTLESLRLQDYPALELFLVDGGSTDATLEIARPYLPLFKWWVSEPDRGQTEALNKGFRRASGDVFGWLCADDELAPGALRTVGRLFADHPEASVLTGGCLRKFADGTVVRTEPGPRTLERISYHNGMEQPSTFWRATLHRAAGELDEDMHLAFDWAWWNRLKLAGARLITTPEVLSHYYFSPTNKTSTGGTRVAKEMYQVIKKFGPLRGRLADIYFFLYSRFDLHGCYDNPPTPTRLRRWCFRRVLKLLRVAFGEELIYSYNWNFASKQQRNLCWYK